jgi:hypothetical protein
MMDDKGCLITSGFSDSPEDVFGKLVIAPTEKARVIWDSFRTHPTAFEFAVGFIGEPDEDGVYKDAELVEISLVVKQKESEKPKHA